MATGQGQQHGQAHQGSAHGEAIGKLAQAVGPHSLELARAQNDGS